MIETVEDLKKLTTNKPFQFKCIKCGEICTINKFRCERIPRYSTFLCEACYRVHRSRELYGVDNPMQSKEKLAKRAQTNLQRYGGVSPLQNSEVKAKANSTMLERYGSENYVTTDEFKNKSGQTKIERYGDVHYNNSAKAIETFLDKYGVDNPMKDPDIANKSISNKESKYGIGLRPIMDKVRTTKYINHGDPNYNNHDSYVETCLRKYGTKSYPETKEFAIKRDSTNLEKYGTLTPYAFGTKEMTDVLMNLYGTTEFAPKRYIYDGEIFQSSWELALWIYAKDHNESIEREPVSLEYECDGKVKHYIPDFRYNGNLIEIKGDHFFNDSGEMICPWNSSQDSAYNAKLQCGIQNGVIFLVSSDCEKYLNYVSSTYGNNYFKLFRIGDKYNLCKAMFADKSFSNSLNIYEADMSKEFQDPISIGATPFDINKHV